MSEVKPTDEANYPQMWEHRWTSGATHWDQAQSHTALVEFLDSDASDKAGVPRKGRAFVPGCGQGYDVDLFARRGLDSVGLDVAPTGVAAANKWLASQTDRPAGVTAEVVEGDFFKYDAGEGFDLIYDYTFLCALPPTMRKQWGERMTALSRAAPTTRLITLMYPLNGNPPPFGPPFSLTEDDYNTFLGDNWERVYENKVPDERRRKGPPGDEKLVVWKRKL